MANIDSEKLLKDQRVVDEINRHLWIESEKAGRNIGFEEAKADWLKKFAKAWTAYHMPETVVRLAAEQKVESAAKIYHVQAQDDAASVQAQSRKRRAKSYI